MVISEPVHQALGQPSDWVVRFAALFPSGPVLDLACGSGRHSRLLAARGHTVIAVDRDAASLAALGDDSAIQPRQVDLENGQADQPGWPFGSNCYSGIVVTNYLHRPLFGSLFSSLAPGGVLIYETFAAGNGRFGKPSNPDFLLQPGELLAHVAEAQKSFASAESSTSRQALHVIAYEDGYLAAPRPAMVQRICVVREPASPDALYHL